jgi:adenylosuccinate synthase
MSVTAVVGAQWGDEAKGAARTGTTGRGIGPVYADKVSYNGIRLADLANEYFLAEKLRQQLSMKNPILQAFGLAPLDLQAVLQEKLAQFERLRPVVREPFGLLQQALVRRETIILEGAQAALLDNDWGTYPFCTASNTLAGVAAAGLGIAPRCIDYVIGVAKAYTTRAGAGPMPTELLDQQGEAIRQQGAEYGTVTGRPRRCGWLDAALLRFTAQLNGMTGLALTKLDVLDALHSIKICTGYRNASDPQRLWQHWEGDARWLAAVEPEYEEIEGWLQSTRLARRFADLPPQAQAYVHRVEELVRVPVSLVSIGPDRQETFWMPGHG